MCLTCSAAAIPSTAGHVTQTSLLAELHPTHHCTAPARCILQRCGQTTARQAAAPSNEEI